VNVVALFGIGPYFTAGRMGLLCWTRSAGSAPIGVPISVA
jgi:hypothetical protein